MIRISGDGMRGSCFASVSKEVLPGEDILEERPEELRI